MQKLLPTALSDLVHIKLKAIAGEGFVLLLVFHSEQEDFIANWINRISQEQASFAGCRSRGAWSRVNVQPLLAAGTGTILVEDQVGKFRRDLRRMDSMVRCAIRTEAMIEVEYMHYIEIFAGTIVVRWISGCGLLQLLHLYHQLGSWRDKGRYYSLEAPAAASLGSPGRTHFRLWCRLTKLQNGCTLKTSRSGPGDSQRSTGRCGESVESLVEEHCWEARWHSHVDIRSSASTLFDFSSWQMRFWEMWWTCDTCNYTQQMTNLNIFWRQEDGEDYK